MSGPLKDDTSSLTGGDFNTQVAPLFAIIGEQVARQFLANSAGLMENILFSIFPVGAFTTMDGAIRVGGNTALKTLIGRGIKSQSVVEVQFMSSTPEDTCELWNGRQIVRLQGSPEIKELIRIKPAESRSCAVERLFSGGDGHSTRVEQPIEAVAGSPRLYTLEWATVKGYLQISIVLLTSSKIGGF